MSGDVFPITTILQDGGVEHFVLISQHLVSSALAPLIFVGGTYLGL